MVAFTSKKVEKQSEIKEGILQKYEVNNNTCIAVASGDDKKLGICITISNQVENLYGYKIKDIEGNNVNKLIPYCYKEVHDHYFKDFFEREEETRPFLNIERNVFPMHKEGHLVASSLLLKCLPEIDGYVKMVLGS
jgi:PAS domain S-box-containing protein